ncbi:hypothetical protein LHV13_07075 [Ferrovum sp. PN-J185]|nr:hypothetical protein [Ferrovum sp. PN-J185]KXW56208.1 hypothetical protein FV185_01540 [Ferrovum sp. PN-J185]MCC6068931.1 hypothetical protein [Ferrovum sp. PN-J185]MDE1891089.1 hypothetical protein [Betaproteobacteria bacterium]MDE2055599.1 hypothetical protein [Betaproteobacteria bacterium]
MIIPDGKSAASYVDNHRDEIVGESIVNAVKEFSINEDSLKTIYIKFNQ